jgi:ParB family chromosome partitioning protein
MPKNRGPEPSSAHFREIETVIESPDAEPVSPCAAARTAIIAYGKRVGTTTTVCTDDHCPVHDPQAVPAQATNPAPTIAPAPLAETEEEAGERQRNCEQQRKEYEEEQERRAEVRRQEKSGESRSTRPNAPSSTLTHTRSQTTWPRRSRARTRMNSAPPKRFCFPPSVAFKTTS